MSWRGCSKLGGRAAQGQPAPVSPFARRLSYCAPDLAHEIAPDAPLSSDPRPPPAPNPNPCARTIHFVPIAVECGPTDLWKVLGEIAAQFVEREGTRIGVESLRIQFFSASFFQVGQVVDDEFPNDRRRHSLVVVSQDVADAGDLSPRDIAMPRFQLVRKTAAGLRYDFEASLHQPPEPPIILERLEGKALHHKLDTLDRFHDVSHAWNGGLRHS